MTADDEDRPSGKRDRLARMLRVAAVLQAHPDGIRPADIARRVGVTVRTVYRDLHALEDEVEVRTWSADGLWGVVSEAFLPPLKLTLDEAMAVVLSARLMVRYADKYDPDLAAAFEKLEDVLPRAAGRARRADPRRPGRGAAGRGLQRARPPLTRAWAERRVVTIQYEPARYAPEAAPRRAVVRPYLIEPSLQTHALYLIGWDETRGGLRTFKVERIRDVALTPRTFEPPEPAPGEGPPASLGHHRRPARDRGRPALLPVGRDTGRRDHVAPEPDADAGARRVARLPGDGRRQIEIRLWILSWGDEVEVLAPAELRDDVAATHRRAVERTPRPRS